MSSRVCPWWAGYLLLIPLRRLRQNPRKWLGPFVREGMTVLEPGPGMGFFTLDLARMVGDGGRVVAVDTQEKMIEVLRRRARRSGLLDRIDVRIAESDRLGIGDLAGRIDLVVAIFVVHEMPDAARFYEEAHRALRPGGRLLFAEPKWHVSRRQFERSLEAAATANFEREGAIALSGAMAELMRRP